MKPCGATTRSGGKCKQKAGWGTDHVGQGRCKLHGGATPIKHGRYSSVSRTRIRDLYERHAEDAAPLDVLPELAAARALFQDFVERYDEWRDAFLAWHASFSDEYQRDFADKMQDLGESVDLLQIAYEEAQDRGFTELPDPLQWMNKPRQVLDLSDAVQHLKTIAQIAQKEKQLHLDGAISRKDLLRVLTEMSRVVESYVDDPDTKKRIRDGWRRIQLA